MAKTSPVILIVEDDAALNEAYCLLFDQSGYTVRSAQNGREALNMAASEEPDVIFLDLRMPVMGGLAFLKEYKPKELHPRVKIIVFSNYDMQKEVDQAYSLGADRYVLKAWASPKELSAIARDILSARLPQVSS